MPKLKREKTYGVRFHKDEVSWIDDILQAFDEDDTSWAIRYALKCTHQSMFPEQHSEKKLCNNVKQRQTMLNNVAQR